MQDLQTLIADFRESDVTYAALFGSRVTDQVSDNSDYDFLIEFDSAKKYTLLDISKLKRILEAKLHSSVDLVTTKSVHPYLRRNIFSSAQVLYDDRA